MSKPYAIVDVHWSWWSRDNKMQWKNAKCLVLSRITYVWIFRNAIYKIPKLILILTRITIYLLTYLLTYRSILCLLSLTYWPDFEVNVKFNAPVQSGGIIFAMF